MVELGDRVFLVPSPGLIVRDPVTKIPLPETGQEKIIDVYWSRAILCGDAVVKDLPKPEQIVEE